MADGSGLLVLVIGCQSRLTMGWREGFIAYFLDQMVVVAIVVIRVTIAVGTAVGALYNARNQGGGPSSTLAVDSAIVWVIQSLYRDAPSTSISCLMWLNK